MISKRTDIDWNKIKTEYITTNASYRTIKEKYGVSICAISNRSKQERWVEQKERFNNDIVTESVGTAVENAIDYREELYKLAYKILGQLNDMTTNRTIEELGAKGIKPRDITGAIKDLEDALHVKSEQDIKEQEARITNLRKQSEDGDGKRDVTVRIIGADDYCD